MIIITGASRGIGKFLLKNFIKDKVKVIGTYLTTQPENDLISHYYKLDVTNIESIKNFVSYFKSEIENIVLINCAGTNYNSFAHKSDNAIWKNVIDVNLTGTFNIIKELLPIMREQNYGRIINFSSIVAQTGIPGTSAYAASKAGLWGLSKSISVENANKGITINNLNLGYFNIGMISEVPAEFQEKTKLKIPSKKFGNPKNIYSSIKYIIDNDYINGSSIDVNGAIF